MSTFTQKLPTISSSSSIKTFFKPTNTTCAPPRYVEFENHHKLLFPFLHHNTKSDIATITPSYPPPPPPAASFPSHGPRHLPPLKVALQGPLGSYCHEASLSFFPSPSSTQEELEYPKKTQVSVLPYTSSLDSAFSALEHRHVDLAVAPFENSLDGPIPRNLDLLLRHPDLRILREVLLPVNHCLLTPFPHATIRRVLAHPQAISHCRSALSSMHGVEDVLEVGNPADAARYLALSDDRSTAVIGSRTAASQFGLTVVRTNLQDDGNNYTRFLQVGLNPSEVSGKQGCKTALAFALPRGPSDLFRALWAFETRGVRVNRVDHRPNRGKPLRVVESGPDRSRVEYMDYVYLLEVEGSERDALVGSAIRQLREMATFVRVLGSYDTCEAKLCP